MLSNKPTRFWFLLVQLCDLTMDVLTHHFTILNCYFFLHLLYEMTTALMKLELELFLHFLK